MSLETTAYCDSCTDPIDNHFDLPVIQIAPMETVGAVLDEEERPLHLGERLDLLHHFCRECLDLDALDDWMYRLYVTDDGDLLAVHRQSAGRRGYTPPFDDAPEDVQRIATLYREHVRDDDD